jgi:hypothetical protein
MFLGMLEEEEMRRAGADSHRFVLHIYCATYFRKQMVTSLPGSSYAPENPRWEELISLFKQDKLYVYRQCDNATDTLMSRASQACHQSAK